MFSPRLLAFCALLGAAAALPAQEKPSSAMTPIIMTNFPAEDFEDSSWFRFPLFNNFFAPIWRLFPSFANIGPRVTSDDTKFQIALDVKDFNKDDLKVKVRDQFVIIQGAHETKKDGLDLFASQFFHTYSLPANASASDVTAERSSNGYLVVTAPIKESGDKKPQPEERDVPIVDSGKPYVPADEKPDTDAEKVDTLAPKPIGEDTEDDRKEPTTPPSEKREEATEKDNIIPHGNEVSP